MKFRIKLGLACLSFLTNIVYAKNLSEKVDEYFQTQKQVEHKNSKKSDVHELLSLLTPDARFEHPSFNVVQSKEEYKKGLLYYLGKYGKCDIKIKNTIEGLNAVTVEYFHPCSDESGQNFNENEQKLVTLFEFKDGKISLIRHYF